MRIVGILAEIALFTGIGFTAFGNLVTLTIRTRHCNQDHGLSLQMRQSACHTSKGKSRSRTPPLPEGLCGVRRLCPPALPRLTGGGLHLMSGCQALLGAPGACRRSPVPRFPVAACWTCAALWPPTAAALCRVAFAGGLFPFHAFERSRALFLPLCSFPPCFISRSCTNRGPLRGVMLARVCASRRPHERRALPPRHRRRRG